MTTKPETGDSVAGQDDAVAARASVELSEGYDGDAARWAVVGGWRLLRQEWGLVWWTLVIQALTGLWWVLPALVVLVGASQQLAGVRGEGKLVLLSAAGRLVGWASEPRVVVGALGMFAVAQALAWALGVLVETGVLGALRRRLASGERVIEARLFWKTLGERFGGVLVLRGLGALAAWASVALTVGSVWAGWRVMGPTGGDVARVVVEGGVLAALAVLGVVFGGLSVACLEAAVARLVVTGESAGEALWEAVALVGHRAAEVLQLGLAVVAVLAALVCVYAPFDVVLGALGGHEAPPVSALAGVLSWVWDVALAASWTAAVVWARASLMVYVGLRSGAVGVLPAAPSARVAAEVNPADAAQRDEGAAVLLEAAAGQGGAGLAPALVPVELRLPERVASVVSMETIKRALDDDATRDTRE